MEGRRSARARDRAHDEHSTLCRGSSLQEQSQVCASTCGGETRIHDGSGAAPDGPASAADDMKAGQSADRIGGQAGQKGEQEKLEGEVDQSSA